MNRLRVLTFYFLTTIFSILAPIYTIKFVKENVTNYAQSNLENMMKDQENKLNIHHFGIPKISKNKSAIGAYLPDTDEIILPLEYGTIPGKNLSNLIVNILLKKGIKFKVKEILDHELGHFYVDKLHESLGLGNFPTYNKNSSIEKIIAETIIGEGIAMYFEDKMNSLIWNDLGNIGGMKWPKKLGDFYFDGIKNYNLGLSENIIYYGGLQIVKPIINKHGQRGIEYLITKLPNKEELFDLKTYRRKIMNELDSIN